MEFVEDQNGYARKRRIAHHLPEQYAFGNKSNTSFSGTDVIETDLIADLGPQLRIAFPGYPGG